MTKTLEEILTKLEKDFSELKDYAIKLEAENCMLRKELDKKDEDIPDNCAITLKEALRSAYVDLEDNGLFMNSMCLIVQCFDCLPENELCISSFNRISLINILPYSLRFNICCISIIAVILLHYNIDIKIELQYFDPFISSNFNKMFNMYKGIIKFRQVE